MITRRSVISALPVAMVVATVATEASAAEISPAGTSAVAEEAFIYGFPMIMNYGVIYEYFIDKTSRAYKAPFNQIYNTARVYTPQDTTIVTPNSDTPYSFVGLDLRAEPFVLCTPEIDKSRYFSVQLIDMYTANFGYVGSRSTGSDAECTMIAGPGWKGETPSGITKVFRCETDFAIALIRTQLFNAGDIDNVKKLQAQYRGTPLSSFLKQTSPPAPPVIDWPKITKEMAKSNPFGYINFLLQFCPPTGSASVEVPLRAKFASIGVEAGKSFPAGSLSVNQKIRLEQGAKAGVMKIKLQVAKLGTDENGWRVSTHGTGDRQMLNGDWTLRAAVAMAGIYANDAAEALYPILATDSDGSKPDCSVNRYTLTFPTGQLPPANAFWSVTMYDGKTQLLVANPIDRYLINSPMLPSLMKNPDGSITIYIQSASPGKDKESNWLPAVAGPIFVVMRVYWPKQAALDGLWKPPSVHLVG